MEMNKYQELAARTDTVINTDRLIKYGQLLNAAIGMVGEACEFLEVVKKIVYHGHNLDNVTKDKLVKEIGDTKWYCAKAARLLGVPLSYVAAINIEKLKNRYPDGFSEDKSINRDMDK